MIQNNLRISEHVNLNVSHHTVLIVYSVDDHFLTTKDLLLVTW